MNLRKVLEFFVFVYLIQVARGIDQCPSFVSSSCDCMVFFDKVFLSCHEVKDAELKEVLGAFKGRFMYELQIKNSTLKSIPAKPLKDVGIFRIKLTDVDMFYLFDRPLEGAVAKSLQTIKLSNVMFDLGLDWSLFEEVEKLTDVMVSSSNLGRLSQQLLSLGPEITTLQISDAQLDFLQHNAFSELTTLRNLILRNNLLESFSREMMPQPSSDLNLLDLSNNQLSSLPHNVFDGFPKLHSLMLHGNKFAVLERAYMQKIWSRLIYFTAHNNPLECSCEMAWIVSEAKPYHIMGQCKEIGFPSVKDLKELDGEYFRRC